MNVAEPPIKEEIVYGAQQPSPQEHIQERIVKKGLDIQVPRVAEDFVAVVHLTPQERGQQRIATQTEDIPVSDDGGNRGGCTGDNGPSSMCQCQCGRLWKRQSRWYWTRLNECSVRVM